MECTFSTTQSSGETCPLRGEGKGQREHPPKSLPRRRGLKSTRCFVLSSRKTACGCTNVNPNPDKTRKALQNQRKSPISAFFSGSHTCLPLRKLPVCFLMAELDVPDDLPASVLTCVSAKMSLEVGTFEVRFPAAWKVANIVPPSGKVYLRGTVLTGRNEHWSRSQRQ